jgi:hypothetical protein
MHLNGEMKVVFPDRPVAKGNVVFGKAERARNI